MKTKKLLSFLISLALLIALLPAPALADGTATVTSSDELEAALGDDSVSLIRLEKDISYVSSITIERDLTLDLNGCSFYLETSCVLRVYANVTLIDSGSGGMLWKDTYGSSSPDFFVVRIGGDKAGELTIKSGTVQGYHNCIDVKNNGTLTVLGGSVEAKKDTAVVNYGEIRMTGGAVKSFYDITAVDVPSGGTILKLGGELAPEYVNFQDDPSPTVTFDANDGTNTTVSQTISGGKGKLTAEPFAGRTVSEWNTLPAPTEEAPGMVCANAADVVLNVDVTLYARMYSIGITVNDPSGGTVTGAGRYAAGETVTLTATPADGYVFEMYAEDLTKIHDAEYSFTAQGDRTLTAYFHKVLFDGDIPDQVYTGSQITPDFSGIRVALDGVDATLLEGANYTLSYGENVNAGEGAGVVYLDFSGDFTGRAGKTFNILAADLSVGGEVREISDQTYSGEALEPDVKVTWNGMTVSQDDYTLSYAGNVNVGECTVTVEGTRNFYGTLTGFFRIAPADIAAAEVTVAGQTYSGEALEPDVTVTWNSRTLTKDDYTLTYADNVNAGKNAGVTVKGQGNFTGTVSAVFEIAPADIAAAEVTVAGQTYSGEALEPDVTVTWNSRTLTKDDYTLTYADNVNAGKNAGVTVKGQGNFTGTVSAAFEIAPAAVTVTADDKTKTCGEADPELTAAVAGLVEGEPESLIVYSLDREQGEDEGEYAITPSGKTAQGNYTVTYVPGTLTITAKPTWTVTVENGSGGGKYAEGDTVEITADAPEEGKVFDCWTSGDGVAFADASAETTSFVMPAKAVTVTATYKDAPVTYYTVTVENGTGGGNYAEGDTVTITADAPEEGKVFDCWTSGDGVAFADASAETTTFTMPAQDVTVTAAYKDAPTAYYTVTVENGTGGGDYAEGETVTITADAPAEDKVFDCWTSGDGVAFADASAETTSFVMPAKDVTVTATYQDAPVTYYTVTVENGTGGGNYAEGETVTIKAKAAPRGKVFDKWTSADGVAFADAGESTTTFVMPAQDVTVTATYKNKQFPYYPDEPVEPVGDDWPFIDVTKDMPIYEDVKYVYERGIMVGISDDLFGPDMALSRGMIVTILHRLESEPAVGYSGAFSDVPAGKWFSDGVEWAASVGVVLGYGDGRYGVTNDVTREQLAAILYRYAAWKGYETETAELSAADVGGVSGWAEEAVRWAAAAGILDADADGNIRPGVPATRAEIARAIHVFLERVAG